MNERYICRGKRKDNGEWIEGYLYITHNNEYEIGKYDEEINIERMTYIVIPETVIQCTGMKDKNGRLIFEGDLLRFTNSDNEQSIYKVFYDDVYAGYRIQEMGLGGLDEMSNWEDSREYFEVIGNIHDNPELLEAER